MNGFVDLPLRRKLSVAFTLTITVVILLASAAFLAFGYGALRRTLAESISTSARITADNCTAVIAFNDAEGAKQILAALRSESQIIRAVLFTHAGDVLASYPEGEVVDRMDHLPGSPGTGFADGKLTCVQPVSEGGRRLGSLYVEASLSRMHARLATYGLVVLGVALAASLVGWSLCVVLRRRIEGPIVKLAETARGVTKRKDFSLRAAIPGRDELGDLATAFNRMLDWIQQGIVEREAAADEIRQLNTELEQRVRDRTEKLEEANRELESFSYSVSHDLRAPLRHIHGYAEMLVRATRGTLPEKAARYVQVITEATTDMGQLIDDLLTFSRMGRSELREEIVDLGELVDDVWRGFELACRDRQVEWQVEPLPAVRADGAMLKLVLSNLVGNALKFTRTRDRAMIRVQCVGREESMAVICVSDNGVGFDMAYRDKLFGVFQRLHRAEDFEGTGIGLANVRRIVTRHGGRVWAEGAPDAGAKFYFTLPTVEITTLNPIPAT